MKFLISIWIGLLIPHIALYSQCPVSDFNLPVSACNEELLLIENLSTPAVLSSWDFCSGDLSNLPQAEASFTLPAAIGRPGVELVKDEDIWFGFVTGTWSNTLYRLEFANGTNNLPTSTENLGNLSGKLSSPGQVRIIKESNQWYGFIHNMTSGELLQLNFGNSLSNSFTVSTVFSGIGYGNSGFAIGKDPIDGWVCVISTGLNQFNIIRLGNMLATPGPSDILTSAAVPNPNNLGDVDLVNICGLWYGFADNLGNGNIYRLDFGFNLFSTPTITQVTTLTVGNPGRLRIANEGEEYFVFVIALDGTITKLEFGTDITSNPVIVSEGNVGNILQPNTYGLALIKENSEWTILVISQSNGMVYNVNYPNICAAIPMTSKQLNPEVKYTQAGIYKVSLESTNTLGASVKTKPINISPSTAPDISFTSQNICTNHDVNFTSQNISGDITDYDWDFGDTNTSMAQNPTHQYSAADDYEVSLQVTASNGCNNLARESITIYNEPIANFDLPNTSPGPVCTNQEYLFSNTSIFDVDSNPTWQWEVNGSPVGSLQDLTYLIPTATSQSVKLIASIPGCESEITQVINTVEEGPLPDFSFANDCEDTAILFTDATSGTTSGLSWDFGDGNTSMQTNPSNTFVDFGNYDVTLTASNLAGCMNTVTKPIQVYSKPVPDFSLDLPPFSCAGSLSQFNDLTPSPTDSNLSGWTWSFGDVQNGASTSRNPQYIYDAANQYNVNLEVKTNFNCTASVQKMVTILPAPSADFSFSTACVNQGTTFTPTTTANVSSWQWSIGGSMYAQQSPTHVFSTSSTFNAQLTANGSNGCITVLTKPVPVPVPTNVNFTVENNCTDQNAIFTSTSIAGPDPIVSSVWQFGSLGSGTGANASFVFPSPGVYPTQLTVTNLSGCMFTTTKDVNVVNPPVATFEATPLAGGPPLVLNLINTSSNVASQVWSVDGKTSTGAFATFTLNDLGQYEAELSIVSPEGCTDKASTIVSVVVPALDIELTNLELMSAAAGENNILITLVNHGNVPVNNPDVLIMISEQTPIHETINTVIQPGQTFTQAFTAGTGNINYLCVEVGADGDIDNTNNRQCLNQESGTVVLDPYPNPVADNLNLDWIAIETERVEISIFDPTGRKVFENTFDNLNEGLNHVSISLTELHPGMYYLFFVSGSARKSFPFVLRR